MSKIDTPTDIRKVLLRNGYVPLPAIDKRCILKKWSTIIVTEDLIETKTWARGKWNSTAIRLDRLATPDVDVTNRAMSEDIILRWFDEYPALFGANVPLLERGTTASCKVTFYLRRDENEDTNRITTGKYAHPDRPDEDPQQVEIFSGSGRYSGSIGAHKKDRDGNVLSTYVWPEDSPLDIPIEKLPVLNRETAGALCIIAREVFEAHGYVKLKSADDDHEGEWVYTIRNDAVFRCDDGIVRNLEEMKDVAGEDGGMRCSADGWLEDKTGGGTTRCIAHSEGDRFWVHDFDGGKNHLEASLAPEPLPDITALLPAIDALGGRKPPHGVPGCANMMAAWIARNYVWMPTSAKTQVIPIGIGVIGENAMSIANFRLDCAPWKEETRSGPNGGLRKISAVDVWLCDEDNRKRAVGFALRPNMPRPLYVEDGEWWVNTYKPPVHDAVGGSCDLLLTFVKGLIPETVEYGYLMQCIAHKYRNPAVPGPGIIMVAQDKFGVGRGAFAALLEKIFSYTETIQYDVFTGDTRKNAQAAYNGYEARNLIVVVDEANGHQGWSVRDGTSAKIRDRMSPNARKRQIIEKGVPHRSVMVHVKYVILANDFDMFNMHVRDRRAVVFTNGEPQPPEFYDAVYASIETPSDIARMVDHLMTIDLSDFNPYAPPLWTMGKRLMVDESESDIDRGMKIVLKAIEGRGELFSALHVVSGMGAITHAEQLDYPDGWEKTVQRLLGKRYARVGIEDGVNWKPMFAGRRYPTFAWTKTFADKWKEADPHFVKIELRKTGVLENQFGAGVLADLAALDNGQQADTPSDNT